MRSWRRPLLALGLAILAGKSRAATSSGGLVDAIDQWEHLRVDPASVELRNLRLESGRLVVTLSSATGSSATIRFSLFSSPTRSRSDGNSDRPRRWRGCWNF